MDGNIARCVQKLEELADFLMKRDEEPAAATPELVAACWAIRWVKGAAGGQLAPIMDPDLVNMEDLVGIDYQKEVLRRNTAQFAAGLPANNVLLWGERGNGKSSCIKGLLAEFCPKGLRMVEVQRWDLLCLPDIVALLRPLPFRFIIYCDDLTFSEGETEYRALKTLLEGGLERRPDNILFYATSNRRHLMPERMTDNVGGDEIHPEEAVSEKLALSERFGITIGFGIFNQEEFLRIVRHYAVTMNLQIDSETLSHQAFLWSMYNGGRRNGRTARQFIDDLAGRLLLENGSKTGAQ